MLTVRRSAAGDIEHCIAIIRELPDYFTEDVPAKVESDLGTHPGWVAVETERVVGFAVVDRRSTGAAEILWMAVAHAERGRGVGSALLDQLITELAGEGVQVIEVKTLDRSADYQPYAATNAFYERHGFIQIDTIDPLPGWPPGNPAAIYIAALNPSRSRKARPEREPLPRPPATRG
jgi:ribosomal protein S18 acetylase RimI-like enzyme